MLAHKKVQFILDSPGDEADSLIKPRRNVMPVKRRKTAARKPAKRKAAPRRTAKRKVAARKTSKRKVAKRKIAKKAVRKVRCAAKTAAGTRCKRTATGKSKYCAAHK